MEEVKKHLLENPVAEKTLPPADSWGKSDYCPDFCMKFGIYCLDFCTH